MLFLVVPVPVNITKHYKVYITTQGAKRQRDTYYGMLYVDSQARRGKPVDALCIYKIGRKRWKIRHVQK